ncbi:bifunctional purple acid phosphatase 26-like isoform X1 [Hibiscus syriacus]|uniref:Bifunctional purple acid phosphatase 26-like isoform X1 n=1 Tax=Hibiscus syriacus TaxID=106335 RepID=A0A6A3B0J9_HIBSY|nr:bifunctional purple acid phosphatase 26-like isoform X1 [Hibiscus syriacus]
MELEKWDGNPNIVLNINTRLGVSLPVQFPCFGSVSYSLKEKANLDFTLKVVGVRDTIRNAIEDSIMWPVRKIIPILPGNYSDLELKPVGVLDVKLVQAKDLANKDMVGKSDPFAELFVHPLWHKMKTSKTIVQFELLYCPFGTESSFKNPFSPDFSLTSFERALKTATAETEAMDLDKIMIKGKMMSLSEETISNSYSS